MPQHSGSPTTVDGASRAHGVAKAGEEDNRAIRGSREEEGETDERTEGGRRATASVRALLAPAQGAPEAAKEYGDAALSGGAH